MNTTSPDQRVRTTILTAPQGWGKTLKADGLRREHKCSSVVDGWWPGEPLQENALHLTSCPPDRIKASPARVVSKGWQ